MGLRLRHRNRQRVEPTLKTVTSVNFGAPDLNMLHVTLMAKPPLPRFGD